MVTTAAEQLPSPIELLAFMTEVIERPTIAPALSNSELQLNRVSYIHFGS